MEYSRREIQDNSRMITEMKTTLEAARMRKRLLERDSCKEKSFKKIDPWENQWNVVAINVLMHDSYDVCLVARMNPRDLIPPPSDLVEEGNEH